MSKRKLKEAPAAVVAPVTKFTLTLPLVALKVAAMFAAKMDVRYFLNGVCITRIDKLRVRICATDGHSMSWHIVYENESALPVGQSVIIPSALAAAFKGKVETVALNVDGNVATMTAGSMSVAGEVVDGKFPAVELIVSKQRWAPGLRGAFNPKYLANASNAAVAFNKARNGSRYEYGAMWMHNAASASPHTESNLMSCFEPGFAVLVMPMVHKEAPVVPDGMHLHAPVVMVSL